MKCSLNNVLLKGRGLVLIAGFMTLFYGQAIYAQDSALQIRANDHNDYSRIVFDWGAAVPYRTQEIGPNRLLITFEAAARQVPSSVSLRNIRAIIPLSQNPYQVEIQSAGAGEIRVFQLGGRTIVDAYDSNRERSFRFPEQGGAGDAGTTRSSPSSSSLPSSSRSGLTADVVPQPVMKPADLLAQAGEEEPARDASPESERESEIATAIDRAQDAVTVNPDEGEGGSAPLPIEGPVIEVADQNMPDTPSEDDLVAVLPDEEDGPKEDHAAAGIEDLQTGPGPQIKQEHSPDDIEDNTDGDAQMHDHNNADDGGAHPAAGVQPDTVEKTGIEQEKPDYRSTLFSLSSTADFGLAVFDNYGTLWMVADRNDPFTKPQISGPDADAFLPVAVEEYDNKRVYKTILPPQMNIRGEGGGLIWNIVVTPETQEIEPVQLKRKKTGGSALRGGALLWPVQDAGGIVQMPDPLTGQPLFIVTVKSSKSFAGAARGYVDFDVLNSAVGLVVRSKVDDLTVKKTEEGIEISRPKGLTFVKAVNLPKEKENKEAQADINDPRRIFDFETWRMGGMQALNSNRNIVLASLPDMPPAERAQNLIMLAKSNLSHGLGVEALGLLLFAGIELPLIRDNPEYLALKGMAEAFSWKTDQAFQDLSHESLDQYEEIYFWRAFILAGLKDWDQAYEALPDRFDILHSYPDEIRNRIGIILSEVLLRAGEVDKADEMFRLIKKGEDSLNMEQSAALKYLKGEAARQRGKIEDAKKLWESLSRSRKELYRVKAGLALARLLKEEGDINDAELIDRLESLRYAWRGDDLEARIYYWLGRAYFDSGAYIKGLKIMRDAASLVPNTNHGRRIAADMTSIFTDFYVGEGLKDVSPLDAVALYDEFAELTPPGIEGNHVITRLADHLVRSDLMDRAADLLQYQIDHRLSGEEAVKTAIRLSAIQILDKEAEFALTSLEKADAELSSLGEDGDPEKMQDYKRDIALLRARAVALAGDVDKALEDLNNMPVASDVNRLRADIAWNAGYWDDAAYALEDVIIDEDITLTRPLSPDHAALILQRAVALNLAGDRIGLANVRETYGEAMLQTEKADLFDVITRPRQNAGLSSREMVLSAASEVDLFGDFLNSYKTYEPLPE